MRDPLQVSPPVPPFAIITTRALGLPILGATLSSPPSSRLARAIQRTAQMSH